MFSVTADTNIYISALNFGGLPRRFLNLAELGVFRLAISDAITLEVAKVLRNKKFCWPEQRVLEAQHQISRFTDRVAPAETLSIITVDTADNRILECALAAQSDYIVSGDDHLLRLQQFKSTRILNLASFMEVLRGRATT